MVDRVLSPKNLRCAQVQDEHAEGHRLGNGQGSKCNCVMLPGNAADKLSPQISAPARLLPERSVHRRRGVAHLAVNPFRLPGPPYHAWLGRMRCRAYSGARPGPTATSAKQRVFRSVPGHSV